LAVYTAHASPAYLSGLTLPTTPPLYPALPAFTSSLLEWDIVGGLMLHFTIATTLDPVYMLTYGSRPVAIHKIDYRSPGQFPPPYLFRAWRFLTHSTHSPGPDSKDLTIPFQATFGDCAITEPVAIRAFVWHPDALASPPTFLSTHVSP